MASENVLRPSHYIKNAITLEPIELSGLMNSTLGQAVNYVIRRNDKTKPLEDLEKGVFYMKWWRDKVFIPSPYGALVREVEPQDRLVSHERFFIVVESFKMYSKDDLTSRYLSALFPRGYVTFESLEEGIKVVSDEVARLKSERNKETIRRVCPDESLHELTRLVKA